MADSVPVSSLSDEQKEMIELKKQQALEKRRKRQAEQEAKKKEKEMMKKKKVTNDFVDTGAGFFLEEEDEELLLAERNVTHAPAPLLDPSALVCDECCLQFNDSYLLKYFDATVCDACKEEHEKYDLITKTDARQSYLLNDVDFDRGNPLKFISKKNPHHKSWGEMKLFLKTQVERRCLEIWESMDKVEEERKKRQQAKEVTKQKKFDKKVKELRMTVRSSLWTKDLTSHQHEFGEETYHSDTDEYSKTCATCGHVMNYEKM